MRKMAAESCKKSVADKMRLKMSGTQPSGKRECLLLLLLFFFFWFLIFLLKKIETGNTRLILALEEVFSRQAFPKLLS